MARIFKVINIILAGSLLYFGYFFFFSDYYQIKNSAVTGVNYVGSDEVLGLVQSAIRENSFGPFKTQNIFLLRENKILDALTQRYVFASISLKKKLPNTIIVDVMERHVVYRVSSASSEYLVDDQGVVVRKNQRFTSRPPLLSILHDTAVTEQPAEQIEGNLVSFDPADQFTVLYLAGDADINLGDQILSPTHLSLISDFSKNATTQLYSIRLLSLPATNPQFMTVTTVDGWKIIYSVNIGYAQQYQTLNTIISQEIKPERLKRLDYVDLRLNDNVYYKLK